MRDPNARFPRPRHPRAGLVVLVAASLALVVSGLTAGGDAIDYYVTPTEARGETTGERVLRVGGRVVEGSVEESRRQSTLVLSDGETRMHISYEGRLPDVIQEGQGAVVEGRWEAGEFRGTDIVMRHSNEYRAEESTP